MSNLLPSTFTQSKNLETNSDASTPTIPNDCLACRISGTITFVGVGIYSLTVARRSARTSFGRAGASLFGLGFLAIGAVRWTMDGEKEKLDQLKELESNAARKVESG